MLFCYGSIALTLDFIGMGGGFSTLCHNRKFHYQQGMPKIFPCPGYPRSEEGWIVWLHLLLVNLYVSFIFVYLQIVSFLASNILNKLIRTSSFIIIK